MDGRRNSYFRALTALLPRRRHSRGEIIEYQNKQLKRLMAHAYRTVPYYRNLFDKVGLQPRDMRGLADLQAIPISSKSDLKSCPLENVIAKDIDPRRLIVRRTTGWSGIPFEIRRTWLEERILNAFRLRATRYFGLRMRDRTVALAVQRSHPNDHQLLRRTLDNLGLYRVYPLSCLESPAKLVDAMVRIRPDIIESLPGVLSLVERALTDQSRRLLRPRFVITGGEVLTPHMREQIHHTFAVPVYDTYGSHEFHLMAWQCKQTSELHTCDDSVVLEVIKNGRAVEPGERGEVVVTSLHSYAMPFIRYRLGDIVTRGRDMCPCGEPFSTVRAVQGRMIDYFILPDGRRVHPYDLVLRLVQPATWIRQYQLLQERKDRIVFRVVPSVEPGPSELARLPECVRPILGPDVEFCTAVVPTIPLEDHGKFRVSRSLVYSQYDDIDWEQPDTHRGEEGH